jgi:hypothetical protein
MKTPQIGSPGFCVASLLLTILCSCVKDKQNALRNKPVQRYSQKVEESAWTASEVARKAPETRQKAVEAESKPGAVDDGDPILGFLPLTAPNVPPGVVVTVTLEGKPHSPGEFARIANGWIAQEEKSLPPAGTPMHITFDPEKESDFAEVDVGSGIGTVHLIISINRALEVTRYRRVRSRG